MRKGTNTWIAMDHRGSTAGASFTSSPPSHVLVLTSTPSSGSLSTQTTSSAVQLSSSSESEIPDPASGSRQWPPFSAESPPPPLPRPPLETGVVSLGTILRLRRSSCGGLADDARPLALAAGPIEPIAATVASTLLSKTSEPIVSTKVPETHTPEENANTAQHQQPQHHQRLFCCRIDSGDRQYQRIFFVILFLW